jgi:5,10-methylenetetrahydromethanopterin reductase
MPGFDLALPYSRGADEVPGMLERARVAESEGARALWVSDDWYGLDAFAALAAVGQHCRSPKLAVGVTNPFARHLVQTAAAAMTADRLCGGGRVIVTLGRSARYGVEHLGMHFGDGQRALADGVRILRKLLRGEECSERTEHFRMDHHRMTWPIHERPIPVYLAAIGPKTLELAGEAADGVLLSGFCTLPYVEWAIAHVQRGAERAGRSLAEIDVVCPQSLWLGTPPAPVYDAVRVMVGTMCLLPGVADAVSVGSGVAPDWAARYRAATRADELFRKGDDLFGAFVASGGREAARPFLTDELLRQMFLFGEREAIAAKLGRLFALGVNHVSLTPTHLSAAETLRTARSLAA